jgi:hypothetical protein
MTPPSIANNQPRAPHLLAGAVVGVLAGAVAIGAAQLAAGLTVPQSSPVLAVGQAAIDLTPPPVKDFAISTFGAHDKTVLLGGILVVLALYAALVGILAVHRLMFGMWGLALFVIIGLAAALTRPNSTPEYIVPTLVGAAAGAFALARLARAAARLSPPPARTRPAGRLGRRRSRTALPLSRRAPRSRRRTGPRQTCPRRRTSRLRRRNPLRRRRPIPLRTSPIRMIRGRHAGPGGGGSWSPAG